MIEGLFVVIEGVDGAGTTTHTKYLSESFKSRGLPVHTTREPSDGPVGMLLRQILTGRLIVPGIHGGRPPSWTTMALLFAADRQDHLESEIVPNLMDGVTVISDRYDYSSVAYQALNSDEPEATAKWVRELNRHSRRPDLTIVIDVPPDVSASRRGGRSGVKELYDDEDFQYRLAGFYDCIDRYFPEDRIVHVKGDRDAREVAADIAEHVRILRGE